MMVSMKQRAAASLTALVLAASLLGPGAKALASSAAPEPPKNPSVTLTGATAGQVRLTWDAPTTTESVVSYQIFRVGNSAPNEAAEITYLGQVAAGSERVYLDLLRTEGNYRYAVIAVDAEQQASQPSHWAPVAFDQDGNGTVTQDTAAPGAPQNLNLGGAYSRSRSVTLTWEAPAGATDLWRFLIYRATNDGVKSLLGYVNSSVLAFSESLNADGVYTYFVVAQDHAGNISTYSTGRQITVDTAAPIVTITSPEDGKTYAGAGQLNVIYSVSGEVYGYPAEAVSIYLDTTRLATPVISLSDLAEGAHRLLVAVTDHAGNVGAAEVIFRYHAGEVEPAAPQNLSVPAYSRTDSVTLRWEPPVTGAAGVTGYRIYRGLANAAPQLVTTLAPTSLTYTDSPLPDGVYSYRVAAQYGTAEASSPPQSATVDTVAPVIAITSPADRAYTRADSPLLIAVAVADETSGVDNSGVRYLLDGRRITTTRLDLTRLAAGEHTFRVDAVDRAGNLATASVTFTLTGSGTGDDDDDDEDDNDRPGRAPDLIALLTDLKDEIAPGHFSSLMAFARQGNLKAFGKHLEKFGNSRFISEEATEQLLAALDSRNSVPGKGNGKGKGR